MKYAILTAKHHDGFCLFDSKYTDYKVTNTSFGRDIVAEYAEALVQANKQFDMQVYTNRNHSIFGGNTRFHLFTRLTNHFKEHLQEK